MNRKGRILSVSEKVLYWQRHVDQYREWMEADLACGYASAEHCARMIVTMTRWVGEATILILANKEAS